MRLEIFKYVVHFTANLLKMRGKSMSKWYRVGSEDEDKAISEAARELLEGISNADLVNKVKGETKLNLREQISIEEVESWAKDRDLRGFGVSRN